MRSRHLITSMTLCLAGAASHAVIAAPSTTDVLQVDVFTTAAFPIESGGAGEATAEVHKYDLDGVAQFERRLSSGLPADPTGAKEVVLQRVGNLTAGESSALKSAAEGLALAAQLGVERVPAVVFNREAVVYGERRVANALDRYRDWRREQRR